MSSANKEIGTKRFQLIAQSCRVATGASPLPTDRDTPLSLTAQ